MEDENKYIVELTRDQLDLIYTAISYAIDDFLIEKNKDLRFPTPEDRDVYREYWGIREKDMNDLWDFLWKIEAETDNQRNGFKKYYNAPDVYVSSHGGQETPEIIYKGDVYNLYDVETELQKILDVEAENENPNRHINIEDLLNDDLLYLYNVLAMLE